MIDEKSEEDFDQWLESITFVGSDGKILPTDLVDGDSPDPEGDREGV